MDRRERCGWAEDGEGEGGLWEGRLVRIVWVKVEGG